MNKTEEKVAWVVYSNTDLTEGKGWEIPIHVCDFEATARRLGSHAGVQGSDARVHMVTIYRKDGDWYGPVRLIDPTREDVQQQARLDKRAKAEKRARDLGLTDEEIETLSQ